MNAANVLLVERARAGDPSAFADLISTYRRVCLSIAFKVLSDTSTANDVCQDAFIKAWQRLGDLREPGHFGTWLCGIVRNLAVDRVRRRRRSQSLNDVSVASKNPRLDPLDDLCRRESYDILAGALAGLDETARTALTLRYYDRLPSKQIAQVLGITPDAVDMRLIRARKRLRAAIPQLRSA